MRYPLLLLFGLVLMVFACKRKQEVAQAVPVTQANPKPTWVNGKPNSSLYFQGIGMAMKNASNADHLENAKKSALNDLASEIVVNVSSNSLLYTLEREYKFQSEFIETINTTTNLELEGFETAGTWEDDKQYWVYYRLNRNDYYAKKAAQKQQAIERAADYYTKGKDAWSNQQLKSALDLQMKGLMELKKYWAESNEYTFEGKTILLDKEIFLAMQEMAASLNIVARPESIKLNLKNDFSEVVNLKISDRKSGKNIDGVPVTYSYKTASGTKNETVLSASGGSINIAVGNPDRMLNYNELRAKVDLEKMMDVKTLDREMLILLRNLATTEIKAPIQFERPIFFVESVEQNLNQGPKLTYLKDQLSSELIKSGMTLSNDKNLADVIVKINGKTRAGEKSNGFSIAFLNLNLSFTDLSGKKVFFESTFNDIKGVGNTFEQAGIKAFEKAKESLNSRYANDALNAII
jgi:hypothetical protein